MVAEKTRYEELEDESLAASVIKESRTLFAEKWVQDAFVWGIRIMATAILAALLGL